jgi:hypothetical protein
LPSLFSLWLFLDELYRYREREKEENKRKAMEIAISKEVCVEGERGKMSVVWIYLFTSDERIQSGKVS